MEDIMRMLEEEYDPNDVVPADIETNRFRGDDPVENFADSGSRDSSDSDEDEEELLERFEMEVEDGIAHFMDELSIRDEVPDSDSDDEDAVELAQEGAIIRRSDGNLRLHMRFNSATTFKEAVLDYVLKTGKNIKQHRWDKNKLGYCCAMGGGCPWRVYASVNKNVGVWEIRIYEQKHTCIANGACDIFKVPVIARLFMDKTRQDQDLWLPMKMQAYILEHWKLSPTKNQVQSARKKVLKWLDREYASQFEHIKHYGVEILDSNPGSTVNIGTITNEDGSEVFQRFYVCFNNIRTAWKQNCRPILGVDGCFIKTRSKGQVLVAVGRDADNKIFPVAWAVVQVENELNWLWFVQMLKHDLELGSGEGTILISDRQKGLLKAIATELPMIEHRMCVRHVYGNLKTKHGKKMTMLKPLIWTLAWSYNEAEYASKLNQIKEYDLSVYNDVMRSNPKSWCRVFHNIGNYCEDVDNNFTESYNNTLVKAREKALIPMLEMIRSQAMVRVSNRFDRAERHIGVCSPYVVSILEEEHQKASLCRVYRSSNRLYESILYGEAHRVDMNMKTCSCRKWEIRGIPCEHAYGVILNLRLNVEDYVAACFSSEVWRNTYAASIVPLRGAKFWCRGDIELVLQPPVPIQPGRRKRVNQNKKQKRRKAVNESPTKKAEKGTRKNHCKKCGLSGHNSRSCSKRRKVGELSPQQSQLTQAD